MVGLVLKTMLVVLGCLAAADVAGAMALTVLDVLPLRFASAALPYAVWLVVGGFCGLLAYNIAGAWSSPRLVAAPEVVAAASSPLEVAPVGSPAPNVTATDWSARPGATRIGTGVLVTGSLVIAGVAWLCYALAWRQGVGGDDYVPDSAPHSIVFLLAVLGAMATGRFLLMSDPAED